jgi:hypothetical protein
VSFDQSGGCPNTHTLIFATAIATLTPEERAPVLGHLSRWDWVWQLWTPIWWAVSGRVAFVVPPLAVYGDHP